ncbi:alpha-amylase family glycosyl hydrolase [Orenia marismortui]|uniref:alpha-amylase family glycosyl hydrolase n=1 Tax=Orenia marismortui TaxID=46469 RepID=UPI00035C991E|nr:alpha-amylase family glycosyl hydrolase [Orenia marismortui]
MLKILNKKKIILLTVLLLTLGVFAGCSSDDSESENIGNVIVKSSNVTVSPNLGINELNLTSAEVKIAGKTGKLDETISNIKEGTHNLTISVVDGSIEYYGEKEITVTAGEDNYAGTIVIDQKQTSVPEGKVLIHYQRNDGNYDAYTLWAWGDGIVDSDSENDWPNGYEKSGEDDFGAYYYIPLAEDGGNNIGLIPVDTNENKDGGNHLFELLSDYSELWIFEGDTNIYTSADKDFPEGIVSAEVISPTEIEARFLSTMGIAKSEISVTDKTGSEITIDSLEIVDDKILTLVSSTLDPDNQAPYNITYDGKSVEAAIGSRYSMEELVKVKEFNNLRIYEIFVATFLDGDGKENFPEVWGNADAYGDLDGVIDSLDYIKNLGMNAIWLTPVFESDGESKLDATGYFAKDYFNVDDNWGGNTKLKEVIDEAHARGLYVFLDGVFGHHKDINIPASPSGYTPSGPNDPVDYPESLDFYKEVATYWIEEFEIDGWRLDQAYQLYQDGHNYWNEIRRSVEEVTAERKAAGEKWGTLGYMVGEIWKGENDINDTGYSQNGLRSAFDFPMRYRLVQVLAAEESGSGGKDASALNEGLETHNVYEDYAQPNLMLTNHDLLRFGDLIQRAPHLGYGTENPDYWKRHKAAFSFMAAYTGPVTLYYGDEWGDEREGYVNDNDIADVYDDNVARSEGKISGFTTAELDLKNYVSKLMEIRANHPALWNGERSNLVAENTKYADLKTDLDTGEEIVYVLNTGTSETTISVSNVGGTKLVDLLTGEEITGSGDYDIPVDGLTGRFLLVQ